MALTAEEKLRRKRFNKRLELGISYVHATALAVLGFGVVRGLFDDGAWAEFAVRAAYAAAASVVLEAVALYLFRFLKSEE